MIAPFPDLCLLVPSVLKGHSLALPNALIVLVTDCPFSPFFLEKNLILKVIFKLKLEIIEIYLFICMDTRR